MSRDISTANHVAACPTYRCLNDLYETMQVFHIFKQLRESLNFTNKTTERTAYQHFRLLLFLSVSVSLGSGVQKQLSGSRSYLGLNIGSRYPMTRRKLIWCSLLQEATLDMFIKQVSSRCQCLTTFRIQSYWDCINHRTQNTSVTARWSEGLIFWQ